MLIIAETSAAYLSRILNGRDLCSALRAVILQRLCRAGMHAHSRASAEEPVTKRQRTVHDVITASAPAQQQPETAAAKPLVPSRPAAPPSPSPAPPPSGTDAAARVPPAADPAEDSAAPAAPRETDATVLCGLTLCCRHSTRMSNSTYTQSPCIHPTAGRDSPTRSTAQSCTATFCDELP